MDRFTYQKKLEMYKTSNASLDIKQKAICKLNEEFSKTNGGSIKSALCEIVQSSAELKFDEYI